MVDVDAAEALLAWLDGHPLLAGVIVDHHRSPGLANALFTVERKRKVEEFKGNYVITGQGSPLSYYELWR